MFAANRVIDVGGIVEVGEQAQGGAERDATAVGIVRFIGAFGCILIGSLPADAHQKNPFVSLLPPDCAEVGGG